METAATHTEGFIQARQPWLRNAGIFSLFLYAFFWLLDIEISRIGESLMFLFFVIMLFTNKPKFLLREPIPYLLLGWIIFQVAMYQWAVARFPGLATDHINEARTLTNIFMFLVVAWWLGGNARLIATMLVLCSLGYIIGATFQEGGLLDEMSQFRKYMRLDLGYLNAQHTAVYSTFVLFGILAFKSRIVSHTPERYKRPTQIVIYLVISFSFIAIITSQARASWLGIIITVAIYAATYFTLRIRRGKYEIRVPQFRKKSMIGLIITSSIILMVLASYNVHTVINKRLNAESDVVEKLIKGDTEHMRLTSISLRIETWKLAVEWIKERPITGWGAQSRKALLQQSDWTPWMKRTFRHLHNSYLELLVSYGFIGLSLFAGLFIYIWYRAWQAWQDKNIPNDVIAFSALWSIYWLIVNFFESYVIYSATGNYINAMVAGILYTYHLAHLQRTRK